MRTWMRYVVAALSVVVLTVVLKLLGDHVNAATVSLALLLNVLFIVWGAGAQLVVLPSPYRELTRPLVRYINRVVKQNADEIITVVLPEFIPARWWQHFLHNQSSLLLKGALLFKKGVIVTSVPYHLEH